jgi:regulator of sigma E protease
MQLFPLSIVAFIFVLGILVFVHEFGHYAVAKLFKVRVETFSLGFGKRLIGFRRGDTDYRISLLPLGGYVKMAGENPMEARTGDPGEFMSHPRWQRFLIAIAGPAMNIILAFVVLSVLYTFHHEYLAYSKSPVDVVSITPGSRAEQAGLRVGDRVIKVQHIDNPNWEEFLTRVSINPNQPVPVKVLRGEQVVDLTLVPEDVGKDREGDIGLDPPGVVGMIEPGLPADRAHIQRGDILVSVNGKAIHSVDDLLSVLQEAKGSPVQLTVLRDRKPMTLSIPGQLVGTPDNSAMKYRIGVSMEAVEALPFRTAVKAAFDECKSKSLLIFEMIGKLVRNKNSIKQMSGPIMIMKYSGQAARLGMPFLLQFMALISLNLAIFNMLPIPILDGGLVLMLIVEGVMRRDIKQEVKERVYQAAFVFLVLFAAVIIFNDVAKQLPAHFK